MAKKRAIMTLSPKSMKKLEKVMKDMGFSNKGLFLRYCVLNTIKSKLSPSAKKQVMREMKLIKKANSSK